MKVCLRHEDQGDATTFTDCGWGELHSLLAMLQAVGVYHDGGVYREMEYQIVLGPVEAYAEIILTGEPE